MASIGRLLRRAAVIQRRERRRGRRVQPRFRLSQIGATSLGGLMAVGLLAVLSAWSGHVLIVAPLGASSVLLFGYPRSPLAQPRNVVVGNSLGGFLGVALVSLFGQGPLILALAVGLTILLGQQLRCLHPPAGGTAFLSVFLGVTWPFLLFPVFTGSVLLVVLAWDSAAGSQGRFLTPCIGCKPRRIEQHRHRALLRGLFRNRKQVWWG